MALAKAREAKLKELEKISKHGGERVHFKVIKGGDAVNFPKRGDSIAIHYKCWLEDGTQVDDTYARGQPIYFILGNQQVIDGIEDAVPLLSQRGICSITVPHDLAYGTKGYPPIIPPLATLKYELELVTFSSTGTEERLHRERKKEY